MQTPSTAELSFGRILELIILSLFVIAIPNFEALSNIFYGLFLLTWLINRSFRNSEKSEKFGGPWRFFDSVILIWMLANIFINLIKMMVAPIIFCTIVVGIAKMGDLKEVGRVGLKSIIYFEVVSTLALIIGLVIVNVYQPGVGVNADPSTLDTGSLSHYTAKSQPLTTIEFLLNIIPHHVVGAFAEGNILQVLLFAVLFGVALSQFGDKGKLLIRILDQSSHALFGVIGLVMNPLFSLVFGSFEYNFTASSQVTLFCFKSW